MDVLELMRKRASVREFEEKEVPEELLEKVSEAANLAPTAGNLQAFSFYIVKSPEAKEKLAEISMGQSCVSSAPTVFVFFARPEISGSKYGKRGEGLYSVIDATIAATYAQLAAESLGLGTVWVGAFDEDSVRSFCGDKGIPVCILPVGYPAEKPGKPSRENRLAGEL